jgi:NosR/NirI family nitrous oxide reductase transcriptional regulator
MMPQKSSSFFFSCALLLTYMFANPPAGALAAPFATVATEEEQRIFKRVLPQAETFSKKGGTPLHYKAYAVDPATKKPAQVGFIFLTTDVEPNEIAYAGPVQILVGMTTAGLITGIRVREHREPFGSFSIDTKEFPEQFEDKKVTDAFDVGEDIDAVTRATISVEGSARVIRKSARKILQQYLLAQQPKK